jgi:hypothetical protein
VRLGGKKIFNKEMGINMEGFEYVKKGEGRVRRLSFC